MKTLASWPVCASSLPGCVTGTGTGALCGPMGTQVMMLFLSNDMAARPLFTSRKNDIEFVTEGGNASDPDGGREEGGERER